MRPVAQAIGVVLTSSVLVLTAGAASARPVDTGGGQVAAITWEPCLEDPSAECGTLRLPIDHQRRSLGEFDLAVARRKATDPARRIGVLLINPGGPGNSGVDYTIFRQESFSADVRARFDIVGFDPRGVQRTQPVKCSKDLVRRQPSTYPKSEAEFDALVTYNRELREDCRERSGPIFDHADTGATIQDMDAIRRSLGEQKINYYGLSYGTLMGQQYAERYGDKIRAMVLDSNMDHSLGTAGFAVTEARAAEDAFTEWVKWCDRATSCALHGKDVTEVWDGLLAKADRGEVRHPDDPSKTITAQDIVTSALGAFHRPVWGPLAQFVMDLDAQQPTQVSAFAADEVVDHVFPPVFCEDWHLPVRDFAEYRALDAAERAVSPHMRGGGRAHSSITACVGWPDPVNNPQHRLDIDNAPKILMVNALHDPATAYSWAANAHRQTRGTTVLLTYEGWGHGVYGRSACVDTAVDTYLAKVKTPQRNARCAAVESAAVDRRLPARSTSPVTRSLRSP
ncbi:MAG: alpha/beta hydrolase [Umezawaea sp.]